MVINLTIQAFYMINTWKIVFKAFYSNFNFKST